MFCCWKYMHINIASQPLNVRVYLENCPIDWAERKEHDKGKVQYIIWIQALYRNWTNGRKWEKCRKNPTTEDVLCVSGKIQFQEDALKIRVSEIIETIIMTILIRSQSQLALIVTEYALLPTWVSKCIVFAEENTSPQNLCKEISATFRSASKKDIKSHLFKSTDICRHNRFIRTLIWKRIQWGETNRHERLLRGLNCEFPRIQPKPCTSAVFHIHFP